MVILIFGPKISAFHTVLLQGTLKLQKVAKQMIKHPCSELIANTIH